MKTPNAQRKINIIKNIEYLMRTRGETKASFFQPQRPDAHYPIQNS